MKTINSQLNNQSRDRLLQGELKSILHGNEVGNDSPAGVYSPRETAHQKKGNPEKAKVVDSGNKVLNLEDTCSFLKQENKWYPPYCKYNTLKGTRGYCEKMWDYAGVKYCKEKLR